MEGRFFKHRSINSAVERGTESFPEVQAPVPTSASQFAAGLRQMLGEEAEPDALFFIESWTLTVPEALENLRRRQSEQAVSAACKINPARESLDQSGSAAFMQQKQWQTQTVSSTCATAVEGFTARETPQVAAEGTVSQGHPQHRGYLSSEDHSGYSAPDLYQVREMTVQRAWTLLGVAANSTRAQIRTAYRRMVSRWHPDRHQHMDEESRQAANEKMSAINEAYRLLSSHLT